MKYKCDQCDRPATHHAVEVIQGEKIEKHLCDEHAAEHGLLSTSANTPINELLTHFVKMSGGGASPDGPARPARATRKDLSCPDCGLKLKDFRDKSLLGCAGCYRVFEKALVALVARAHEGGDQHIGKVPRRGGGGEQRQLQITRIRKRLDDAVAAENYELAAQLRDDLSGMGQGGTTGDAGRAARSGPAEEGQA